MLLQPKSSNIRKLQRRSNISPINKNNCLMHSNSFGLKALESGWVTARQIEATRKAILHCTKRIGLLYLRIFPDKALTARSKESRMGSGKGSIDHWSANVRLNSLLFELRNVSKLLGLRALIAAKAKLPIKTDILIS